MPSANMLSAGKTNLKFEFTAVRLQRNDKIRSKKDHHTGMTNKKESLEVIFYLIKLENNKFNIMS